MITVQNSESGYFFTQKSGKELLGTSSISIKLFLSVTNCPKIDNIGFKDSTLRTIFSMKK